MSARHTRDEIFSVLESVAVAVVTTSAGSRMRNRTMHYAADRNFKG